MPGASLAEIYFIAAMMILILIICAAAVYFFLQTYKREMREKRGQAAKRGADTAEKTAEVEVSE